MLETDDPMVTIEIGPIFMKARYLVADPMGSPVIYVKIRKDGSVQLKEDWSNWRG